jgi:hypothetical protein
MSPKKEDQKIFESLVRFLHKKKTFARLPGEHLLEIGKYFLGTPYKAGTLEHEKDEHLIVNLRKFDCVTFVESVIALTLALKSKKKSFKGFRKYLQKIRYRKGQLQGYTSRLHYFSDWIHDNQKKGFLREGTAEMGGRPFKKNITFMTTHPDLYPLLKKGLNLQRMKSIERRISRRSLFFIPKKSLRFLEDRIREGDLIAITTPTTGLDIQHAGFAIRVKNRIHLLHASSKEGKVVLSKKTLYRYLMESKERSGIMVARLEGGKWIVEK